jgi:hypothetical protein
VPLPRRPVRPRRLTVSTLVRIRATLTRVNTRLARIAAVAALVLVGFSTAVLLSARPAAAWTTDQLPNLGYQVAGGTLENGCHTFVVTGYGQRADLGSDCEPDFQQRLDAFVNATCPCAQTTTAATSTAATTTTTATVDTAPVTTTTAPPPPPPVTVTAPATTTTATDATPPVTTVASTVTVTTTATTTAPTTTAVDVTAELAKLQAEIDALSARVTVLETKTGPVAVGPTPTGYAPAGVTYTTG